MKTNENMRLFTFNTSRFAKTTCFLLSLFITGIVSNSRAQQVLEYKKHYQEGQAQLKAGNYTEAIASLDKAINRMPYYSAIYAERGKAKLKAKDYIGAVDDFTITLTKKPYDYRTYLLRGIAYYHLQDYDNAELDLKDALHYQPYDRETKQYLAKTQSKQKELYLAAVTKQNEVLATQNPNTQQAQWERQQRRHYRNRLIWGTIIPIAIWTGILLWR